MGTAQSINAEIKNTGSHPNRYRYLTTTLIPMIAELDMDNFEFPCSYSRRMYTGRSLVFDNENVSQKELLDYEFTVSSSTITNGLNEGGQTEAWYNIALRVKWPEKYPMTPLRVECPDYMVLVSLRIPAMYTVDVYGHTVSIDVLDSVIRSHVANTFERQSLQNLEQEAMCIMTHLLLHFEFVDNTYSMFVVPIDLTNNKLEIPEDVTILQIKTRLKSYPMIADQLTFSTAADKKYALDTFKRLVKNELVYRMFLGYGFIVDRIVPETGEIVMITRPDKIELRCNDEFMTYD